MTGVDKSTISREFKRNIPGSGINADKYIAWRATRQRHKVKLKRIRFTDELKQQAKQWMANKCYSPELVAAQ